VAAPLGVAGPAVRAVGFPRVRAAGILPRAREEAEAWCALRGTHSPGGERVVEDRNLERRLEDLSAEVVRLGKRVASLEAARGTSGEVSVALAVPPTAVPSQGPRGEGAAWGTASTILSRTAVVCFLLVVALALRTLTDAGLLATAPGAGVGVAYAVALLAAGWVMVPRRGAVASLVALCGSLLLCAIVVEARTRLGVLPASLAYGLLAGAGGALALLGRRGATVPVCAGAPALLVAGVLVGVAYPGLGSVVLGATAAALSVARRPRCGWLPWLVVLATAALWAGWAWRVVGQAPAKSGDPTGAAAWYLPALTVFVVLHLAAAYRGAWSTAPDRPGVLDALVPASTVAWAYPALAAFGRGSSWPVAVGLLGVGVLLLLAAFGARQGPRGAARVSSFANGAALLGLVVAGSLAPLPGAVPLLAAGGFGLAFLAERWGSGGTRAGSYALQGSVAVWAAVAGAFAVGQGSAGVAVVTAGGASALAFLHYRRSRSRPAPEPSWFFGRLDRTDDTAVVVLLASLGLAFLAARAGVHPLVAAWAEDVAGAFQGAQSVIIHLSAVILCAGAWLRRDTELRGVALLVIAVGAVKALLYDLFALQGLPLVASVLVFGAAAAAIAVLLRRWPLRTGGPAGAS